MSDRGTNAPASRRGGAGLPARPRPSALRPEGAATGRALMRRSPAPPTEAASAEGWSARRPMMIGLVALAVLLGGFGTWSVLTDISGAVIAGGQLEVEQNRQVVQHPDGGVVESILVSEGDAVEAGGLLLRFDGSHLRGELAIVESQYFETLARRGRLEAERDGAEIPAFSDELLQAAAANPEIAALKEGQRRLFEARADTVAQLSAQLDRRAEQIEAQIRGIDAQTEALEQQLDFNGQELAAQRSLLEQGLAQSARVLGLQREDARIRGALGELAADRARAEGSVTEVSLERLRLQSQRREDAQTELRELGVRELELAQRRGLLRERLDRLDVRAPVSGVVHGLQVTTPRAVVRPADPVLFLVPQDRPLVIAAQVNTSDIDQVHVGQEVRLIFSAFSMRTTPELIGRVVMISADAFTDQATGARYYRAEIVMDEDEIEKLEGRALVPGMPVEAFLTTAPQSPLSYLVKPLTDYFNHAFRER